jgi:hypothetical protein
VDRLKLISNNHLNNNRYGNIFSTYLICLKQIFAVKKQVAIIGHENKRQITATRLYSDWILQEHMDLIIARLIYFAEVHILHNKTDNLYAHWYVTIFFNSNIDNYIQIQELVGEEK